LLFERKGVPLGLVLFLNGCLFTMVSLLILIFMPKSILSKFRLLRKFRQRLVESWQKAVDLTLEGPVFRLWVWSGKKIFVGRLASMPRAPHGLKVKASGISEADVTLCPTWGWNPFHEEDYVLAWRPQADIESDWTASVLKRDEACEDISGKSSRKNTKLKTFIEKLPEGTTFQCRMAAVSIWGQGPWSKQVTFTTMSKPSVEWGSSGPLGPAAAATGSGKTQYRWVQTRNEIGIKVPVGPNTKAKDIKFKVTPKRLELRYGEGSGSSDVLLAGYLSKPIVPDEATWILDSSPEDGRHIAVTMFKTQLMDKWDKVFDGEEHTQIDEREVRWFVDPLASGTVGDLYE